VARLNNRLAALALSQGMVDPMRLARAVEPLLRERGIDDWLQFFLDQELLTVEQANRLRNAFAATEPEPDDEVNASHTEVKPPPSMSLAPFEEDDVAMTQLGSRPARHPEFDVEPEPSSAVASPSPRIEDWMRESDTINGSETTAPDSRAAPPAVPPAIAEAARRAGVVLPGSDAFAPSFPAPRKYILQREVGRGGVARVFEALDNDVGRKVAVKVLKDGTQATPRMLEKLIEEAQITGQLEHPNIVPVHDLGLLPSGEVFFAMKLVRGRSLAEILRKIRAGDEAVARDFSRMRILTFFQQICMAIAFAHDRGVIHRDLKPENILIGDHGEVAVMDWGLARVLGRRERQSSEEQVRTLRSEGSGSRTVVGTISGTPSYMPPEQAMGNVYEIDARSDVYSLGAMLYEILTLVPPFTGRDAADILTRVVSDEVVPPSARAPDRAIPALLEEVCLRALAKKKEARYPSARALYADVEAYLEGTRERQRKQAEAARHVEKGEEAQARYELIREEIDRLAIAAREAARKVSPWSSPADKRRLWELEDLGVEARNRLAESFAAAIEAYSQALGIDPSSDAARDALADLYLWRLGEAEARGQNEQALHFHTLLGQFAGGRYAARLSAPGHVDVHTQPEGARVVLHRTRERNRVLRPEDPVDLGTAPAATSLAPGSYVIVLEHTGFATTRVPVVVTRDARVEVKVPLRSPEAIGERFVYVPAGSYLSGGDPLAPEASERRAKFVKAFAIGVHPVTVGEYLEFVNDLWRTSPEEAQRRVPRATATAGFYWTERAEGGFRIDLPDPDGDVWEADWPAMGVSWQDAVAYCAWRSRRDGATYRLPTRDEWEKAARGVDGRLYPWGDHFDPTFCKMESSREGRPMPEPVGAYPIDESVYGVRDLAGTIMEWTASRFLDDDNLRTLCGGAWRDPALLCRATWETGASPVSVSLSFGFRLARSV
jgi:serine/threonine-protein kinase